MPQAADEYAQSKQVVLTLTVVHNSWLDGEDIAEAVQSAMSRQIPGDCWRVASVRYGYHPAQPEAGGGAYALTNRQKLDLRLMVEWAGADAIRAELERLG